MKVVAIFAIVFGGFAILCSLGMAAVGRWIFGLGREYLFHPEFYW